MGVRKLAHVGSIAASATYEVGTVEVKNLRTLTVTCKVAYNGSATAGVRLAVYYSPNGKSWDTVPYAYFDVNFSAGATVQETHVFDMPEDGAVTVKVINNDTSYSATDVDVWFSEATWGGNQATA